MRAILIKPDAEGHKHVEVVEYDGDYRSIYGLISWSERQVTTFDCVMIDETHTMFVDDEGLLHAPQHFMVWDGYEQPIAGRGLILGTDEWGESVACELNEDWVREQVTIMDIERVMQVYG